MKIVKKKITDGLHNYIRNVGGVNGDNSVARNSERLRKILRMNLSGASKDDLIRILALPFEELNNYKYKNKLKFRTRKYTSRNALRILGLDSKASAQDIRKKYKEMAVKVHPNKNPATDAHTKFIELSQAYEFLKKKPVSRRKYNAARHSTRRELKKNNRSKSYNNESQS